jgi:hypothetical protein
MKERVLPQSRQGAEKRSRVEKFDHLFGSRII